MLPIPAIVLGLTPIIRPFRWDRLLLTYALPEPHHDGEYHEIRVEVLRDGVEVRARDGYYDISDAERRKKARLGQLVLGEPSPLLQGWR